MKLHTIIGSLTAPLLVAAAQPAAAADATGQRDRVDVVGPNRSMLRSGVWTLGLSYLPAAAVAIESSLPADDNLYIPVAGPWLDYAQRDCPSCEHENLNKVLLVTDGVVQGFGALQILGSFLFLETRSASATPRTASAEASAPRVRITPAKLGKAYGIAASTRF
jgi:hypothetical protein